MSETPIIQCRTLAKTYREGRETLRVFSDVNLSVAPGETLAIVGSSGSGKTTLLNMLGGLDRPSEGDVWIDGEAIHGMRERERCRFRNRTLGFVYQFHHLLAEFSALDNVALPAALGRYSPRQARAKARDLLERVGLGERLRHKPSELSGGERQRVAIARALVNDPRCVLMDEPTGNLDDDTGERIQGLMRELNEQLDSAFVVVTHDLELAQGMGRVLRLDHGGLSETDS
ncbi:MULTISPECIES: ABC transporter ATP-binding protein [Halomonadaceae]|uniref:ATP-binding cassette domain-containing protein n=1 Tax=Vreelandella halophila TaxID=86177 RepID=A0A9X4YBU6_9GAMM|nr:MULTISPECIES: ATP-binding cassette domain-containing protein [Halomonas]MYL26856.1 ATP-binding cassette domain-containing protein [Halomonas utahensis]MYL74117.1 ATP-binding cassette domain-containing protein [Halomonas sp. 22501_18_FS]